MLLSQAPAKGDEVWALAHVQQVDEVLGSGGKGKRAVLSALKQRGMRVGGVALTRRRKKTTMEIDMIAASAPVLKPLSLLSSSSPRDGGDGRGDGGGAGYGTLTAVVVTVVTVLAITSSYIQQGVG